MELSKFDVSELNAQFLSAEPFNYIVIDNFLDQILVKDIELELRTMDPSNWYDKRTDFRHINNEQDTVVQAKKIALNIRDQIPEKTNTVISLFESPEMLKFIESVTGIERLQTDPYMIGGGVHKTNRGGHLSIHSDFNIHPQTQKHRRVNALLYLNSNWKPEYGGELELWNKEMTQCVKSVEPISNRLIIFRIRDDAFHGSPNTWQGPETYSRLSLAFYYYTDDRPDEEKKPFHWALWQKRNGVHY